MTNALNNVPRELLDSLLTVIESNGYAADEVEVVDELRALLSAPSPAGVDGLAVVAYIGQGLVPIYADELTKGLRRDSGVAALYDEPLCRLSDAQAIIDGLRGEVERLQMQLAACGVVALANTIESADEARQMHPDYMSASCSDVAGAVDRGIALRTERDQQAQRIAELEGLVRNAFPRIDITKPVPLDEKAHCCEYTIYVERERLHKLIDAALSASSAPK